MRIRWTRPAAGDLTQICDYIEKHGAPLLLARSAFHLPTTAVSIATPYLEPSSEAEIGAIENRHRMCKWKALRARQ